MNNKEASLTKKYTTGKYIFWDIDGTLAPYRFNGHLADPDGTNNGMSIKEINDGVFLRRKPSKFMQNVVETCGAKKNIILSHTQNEKEKEDKILWLKKHYPAINEYIIVLDNISKADTIIKYCANQNIDIKDVIFVDDVLTILREAERKGIAAYHISSFLDWNNC